MIPIFPENGLHVSVLTPVFVGLLFAVFFTEVFGFSFVALVVPGYLTTVFLTAPLSGFTICGEALITYGLSRLLGIVLPRFGLWTVFFGRERFFLLIAVSVVVRLSVEGFALPLLARKTGFAQESSLYSIGLVLVPLTANAFWNVGLVRGIVQTGTITALTACVVVFIVRPLTNLSFAPFELTYESVAFDFFGSPKAYMILLSGAVLGAYANVRFGWDFNGILVPGLLATAWYSPTQLLSTIVEAVLVVRLAKALLGTPWFSRALVEGPRRVLLAFSLGYVVKLCVGYAALVAFPGLDVREFYGFGYVLPTLVAVKMWQKNDVPKVLVPTFVVSLSAALLGNAAGYVLDHAIARPTAPADVPDTAPPADADAVSTVVRATAYPHRPNGPTPSRVLAALSELVRATGPEARQRAVGLLRSVGYRVDRSSVGHGVPILVAWPKRAQLDGGPCLMVRTDASQGAVIAETLPGHPLALVALGAFVASDAHALWIDRRHEGSSIPSVLGGDAGSPRLVLEASPDGARVIARSLRVRETALSDLLDQPTIPASGLAVHAAEQLGARPMRRVASVADAIPRSRADDVSVEAQEVGRHALRAFDDAYYALASGDDSTIGFHVAMLDHLGFEVVEVEADGSRLACDRSAPAGLCIQLRPGGRGPVVAAPEPHAFAGLSEATRILAEALDAKVLLLGGGHVRGTHGSTTSRSATFAARAVEVELGLGSQVASVRGIPSHVDAPELGFVVSAGHPIDTGSMPVFAHSLSSALSEFGAVRPYDGSAQLAGFRGANDPALAYAMQHAPDQLLLVYVSAAVRSRLAPTTRRAWVDALRSTGVPVMQALPAASTSGTCEERALVERAASYDATRNPHALLALGVASTSCGAGVLDDPDRPVTYLVGETPTGRIEIRLPPSDEPIVSADDASYRRLVRLGRSVRVERRGP